MKKQLIIGALSFAAILFINTQAKAQEDASAGTANVSIELLNFNSIDAGSGIDGSDNDIAFIYDTPAKYNDPAGQSVLKSNHLIITAANDYTVKVKATGSTGENFTTTTASEIPLNVLSIQASSSEADPGTMDVIALSTTDQDLIEGATLGAAKSYEVTYFITQEKAQTVLLGKESGTYEATVTYTIVNAL